MHKTISVTVLTDGEASVAEARGIPLNSIGELISTGAAKKHPKDAPNNAVGHDLAVARALRSLADKYEQRAEEAMRGTPFTYSIISSDPSL